LGLPARGKAIIWLNIIFGDPESSVFKPEGEMSEYHKTEITGLEQDLKKEYRSEMEIVKSRTPAILSITKPITDISNSWKEICRTKLLDDDHLLNRLNENITLRIAHDNSGCYHHYSNSIIFSILVEKGKKILMAINGTNRKVNDDYNMQQIIKNEKNSTIVNEKEKMVIQELIYHSNHPPFRPRAYSTSRETLSIIMIDWKQEGKQIFCNSLTVKGDYYYDVPWLLIARQLDTLINFSK